MVAENQDIDITAGDDVERVFNVTEGGSAKPLGGTTPAWGMAREQGGTSVLDDGDAGVGVSITDAAAGEVTLTLSPSATDSLVGDYFHELDIDDVTVSQGVLSVEPETR